MTVGAIPGDIAHGTGSRNLSCKKPKLFLHIGTHKTGTTSIQKFAASHRSELRELGLVYPGLRTKQGPRNPGHHHLAHALSDESSPSVSRMEAMDFLKAVRDDVSENEAILLSAEPFYRHVLNMKDARDYWEAKENYVRYVAEVLSDFDVAIVVVFRRVDKFIQSLYRESVLQSRYSEGICDFIKDRSQTFDYTRQLEPWELMFGAESVMVDIYDDNLRGRGTVDAFFARLGFDITSIPSDIGEEANISLPAKMVELKRRLNAGPIYGRQSLKLRNLMEEMYSRGSFAEVVEKSFGTSQVAFEESESYRLKMEALVDRHPDRGRARDMISDWMTHFEQPHPTNEAQVAALVETMWAMAQSYFRQSAEQHMAYAKILRKIGQEGHAAKAIGRALEFEPQMADYYVELLCVLGNDADAERRKVLRNAFKEMSGKEYHKLLQRVGGE